MYLQMQGKVMNVDNYARTKKKKKKKETMNKVIGKVVYLLSNFTGVPI